MKSHDFCGRPERGCVFRPGRTGEVRVERGGGVQAFRARDADGGAIDPDEEVVVVDRIAERTLIVARVYDRLSPVRSEESP